jgi:hypothetical protein
MAIMLYQIFQHDRGQWPHLRLGRKKSTEQHWR